MHKHYCLILLIIILTGCQRGGFAGVPAAEIVGAMAAVAGLNDCQVVSFSGSGVAERCGISPDWISDGAVLDVGDGRYRLIVAIAKTNKDVEKIEKALSVERARFAEVYENDPAADSIVVRTKGRYCLLIMAEDAKALSAIFDAMAGGA